MLDNNKVALLLHGWLGNSDENWFPWLKKELEKKIFEVYVPNLPSTQKPILEEQLDYTNVYSGDFNEGGLIVGHSLGCQLALKFIEENNINASTIILVAPTYLGLADEFSEDILGDSYNILKKYYDTKIDFDKFKKLNNKIVVFLSDDDPYITINNAKDYYKKLGNTKFVEFKNKGHFNNSAGVLEINEILDYIN